MPAPVLAQQPAPPPAAQSRSIQVIPPDALAAIVASATPGPPATLTFTNRPIVVFHAALLGRSSAERAASAKQLLTTLARENRPVTVASRDVAGASVVTVDGRDVFAIVPADADVLVNETLPSKTEDTIRRLQQAFDERLETTRPRVLLLAVAEAAVATMVFGVALGLLVRVRRRAMVRFARATSRTLSTHKVADEIAQQLRLLHYLRHVVTLAVGALALTLAYWWVVFVLRRFPYTRPWGESLRAFLWDQIVWMGNGIVHAIPAMFTILMIVLVTRFAIKIVHLVFDGVEEGRMAIPFVYPETAAPTRKLVIAMLWLFAIAVSYPYLPLSETEAFKGVSVFVGLMVSLGSSGLVNQVMSGFTVTYSRALRQGDFVRIGDIEGTVTQIGTLSTKIETPRREDVTIPNAVLVSHTVVNYSRNADTVGVYTPTAVTIGYDTPWRQIEALLLLAASRTDGVRADPPPKVMQAGLEDFYVRYVLLVALAAPNQRAAILTRLHAHIQDAFNEHGVQIMSPNYEADPEGRKIVPKDQWYAAPAGTPREPAGT